MAGRSALPPSAPPHAASQSKAGPARPPAFAQGPAARQNRRRSHATAASSSAGAAGAAPPAAPENALLVGAVEALFKFPPFFDMAAANARKMIIQRGQRMGVDFGAQIQALQAVDWEARLAEVVDPSVQTPAYYTQPFHAYPEGNLCWGAALEVSAAAKSVHAAVMDPEGRTLDPEGDAKLRRSFGECTRRLLAAGGARPVEAALDVGCATGLSSLALLEAFPGAAVTGVDLSPHFLAVGRHLTAGRADLTLLHAAAEATGLPDESFDLVSACLVCHELPAAASAAVFREAHRLLRPGGALAVMEMDPAAPAFKRIMGNAFAYVAFKSTEPWLLEYMGLDMAGAMAEAGFAPAAQLENSPRHRTVVAVKPACGAL